MDKLGLKSQVSDLKAQNKRLNEVVETLRDEIKGLAASNIAKEEKEDELEFHSMNSDDDNLENQLFTRMKA